MNSKNTLQWLLAAVTPFILSVSKSFSVTSGAHWGSRSPSWSVQHVSKILRRPPSRLNSHSSASWRPASRRWQSKWPRPRGLRTINASPHLPAHTMEIYSALQCMPALSTNVSSAKRPTSEVWSTVLRSWTLKSNRSRRSSYAKTVSWRLMERVMLIARSMVRSILSGSAYSAAASPFISATELTISVKGVTMNMSSLLKIMLSFVTAME